MKMQELLARGEKAMMRNVARFPAVFTRGEGTYLYDADGKRYLDFLSGIAVLALGHSHPRLVSVMQRQAAKVLHVSNYFYLEEQVELAERLKELSGLDRVFFCNSGAEANEAAIKLARKYGRQQGGKYEIITAAGSFHGRTMGALAATGQPKYQEAFAPLPAGFRYAPLNDLAAWEVAINDRTCAVLIEPVQGEGGVRPATVEFIQGLAELCRKHRLLLMMDEIQTGLGRTGRFFAWEHAGVKPDVLTLAKALGHGIPLGAVLVREEAAVLEPGDHSTTVGGGGMAFAVGLEVLRIMAEEDLPGRAARLGRELLVRFGQWQEKLPVVKEARGLGLMLAVELACPSKPVVETCFERGLLVNAVTPTALRLLPPLTISKEDLEEGLAILYGVLAEKCG
jgi:predicted acetylornithine/succinylornithine family transaminase